jgi:hypothetical protein
MSKRNRNRNIKIIDLSVDVEATGPSPMTHSMIQLGVVASDGKEFYGTLKPLPDKSIEESAIQACGLTLEEINQYDDPQETMDAFFDWLIENYISEGYKIIFWSDNNGFDWAYVNGYLHYFCDSNPIGWSSRRIGDFYAGLMRKRSATAQWKRFRQTEHTHNALDDARGNMEALNEIKKIEDMMNGDYNPK